MSRNRIKFYETETIFAKAEGNVFTDLGGNK